jgi:hypothetical protein
MQPARHIPKDQSGEMILDPQPCRRWKGAMLCKSMGTVVYTHLTYPALRSASNLAWLKLSMPPFAAPEDDVQIAKSIWIVSVWKTNQDETAERA